MFVSCVCCVGSGLCDGLTAGSAESYRLFITVCDLDTATIRRSKPELGCSGTERNPHIVSEQMVSRTNFEIVTSTIEVRSVTSKGNSKVYPKTGHEGPEG
jgi:hypothetical protein